MKAIMLIMYEPFFLISALYFRYKINIVLGKLKSNPISNFCLLFSANFYQCWSNSYGNNSSGKWTFRNAEQTSGHRFKWLPAARDYSKTWSRRAELEVRDKRHTVSAIDESQSHSYSLCHFPILSQWGFSRSNMLSVWSCRTFCPESDPLIQIADTVPVLQWFAIT